MRKALTNIRHYTTGGEAVLLCFGFFLVTLFSAGGIIVLIDAVTGPLENQNHLLTESIFLFCVVGVILYPIMWQLWENASMDRKPYW